MNVPTGARQCAAGRHSVPRRDQCNSGTHCTFNPPAGRESQSESQARSLPGRPLEFNFYDHFWSGGSLFFSLDSEPAGRILAK
jgi:hypothetical protein